LYILANSVCCKKKSGDHPTSTSTSSSTFASSTSTLLTSSSSSSCLPTQQIKNSQNKNIFLTDNIGNNIISKNNINTKNNKNSSNSNNGNNNDNNNNDNNNIINNNKNNLFSNNASSITNEIFFSNEEIELFQNFAKQKKNSNHNSDSSSNNFDIDCVSILVHNFCTTIYGHELVKLGLLLGLFFFVFCLTIVYLFFFQQEINHHPS
jgi:uncharacterized Zn-finger protein